MKSIKHLAFFLAFTILGSVAMAQPMKPGYTAPYKASMDGWLVNAAEAHALSTKTGKPILANFTGTDWCGWCIKLKNEVFLTPQFKSWAAENVILLELDFPRKFQLPEEIKQQNYGIARALGITGYPTIVLMTMTNNDQGQMNINQIGRTGYEPGGPANYIKSLETMMAKK